MNAVTEWFGSIWDKIKSGFEGEATTVEAKFDDFEQRVVQGASLLYHQIISTIGQQGYKLLEEGISDVVATGGNIGEAIAIFVPQAVAEVKEEGKQDAINAAHGAAALIVASAKATLAAQAATAPTDDKPVDNNAQ